MDFESFSRFTKTYAKDTVIFAEFEPGDKFYLIQEGIVVISKFENDKERIIDFLNPGEIFGEMAILEQAPRSATATAISEVKAMEFDKDNFIILMQGNPKIAIKLLKLFAKRIFDQKRRLMTLLLTDPIMRVADVFLMLDETKSQKIDTVVDIDGKTKAGTDDRICEFGLTPDQVASLAYLSLNECKKALNSLTNQGRITVHPEKITVNNLEDIRLMVSRKRKSKKADL